MASPHTEPPVRIFPSSLDADEVTYVYSDGQEPPSYTVAWYEYNDRERPEYTAVSLQGQGPMTGEGLEGWLAMGNETDGDRRPSLEAARRLQFGGAIDYVINLPRDPNLVSAQAGEQAAREVARHLFALAAISRPHS